MSSETSRRPICPHCPSHSNRAAAASAFQAGKWLAPPPVRRLKPALKDAERMAHPSVNASVQRACAPPTRSPPAKLPISQGRRPLAQSSRPTLAASKTPTARTTRCARFQMTPKTELARRVRAAPSPARAIALTARGASAHLTAPPRTAQTAANLEQSQRGLTTVEPARAKARSRHREHRERPASETWTAAKAWSAASPQALVASPPRRLRQPAAGPKSAPQTQSATLAQRPASHPLRTREERMRRPRGPWRPPGHWAPWAVLARWIPTAEGGNSALSQTSRARGAAAQPVAIARRTARAALTATP